MTKRKRAIAEDDFTGPPSGQIHECAACGHQDVWGPGWSWYGSWRDQDDGLPIFKACSDACMARREDVTQAAAHDLKLRKAQRLLTDAEERASRLRERVKELQGASSINPVSDDASSHPQAALAGTIQTKEQSDG